MQIPVPRYTERAPTDAAGLKSGIDLPYNLQPRDVLRMVEDLHDLLHEINSMMVSKSFDRMEELLDPAGFSGFISRSVVDRLDNLSRALVRNEFHNGYPDLLPYGEYPNNSVQHGERGGLEVKASRNASSWESHGPRGGWFCIVQFAIDMDSEKALKDREPTRILAVMIQELEKEDWKWQPAKEGKIRSGTASIRSSGAAKLRASAVWVDPQYQDIHDDRLIAARRDAWRAGSAKDDCYDILVEAGFPLKAREVAEQAAERLQVPPDRLTTTTRSVLENLVKSGEATKPKRGYYEC